MDFRPYLVLLQEGITKHPLAALLVDSECKSLTLLNELIKGSFLQWMCPLANTSCPSYHEYLKLPSGKKYCTFIFIYNESGWIQIQSDY